MSRRLRLLVAIQHIEPDRNPIVIGSSHTTTLKMNAYRDLKAS